MSDKLTRKQVLALSRALKRRGRKLPPVGRCARFMRGKRGGDAGEVCHTIEGGKHVYRRRGGSSTSKFKPVNTAFFDTVKREVIFMPTRGRR